MATDVRSPTNWRTDAAADLQSWSQAVHAALIAVGLVQTADTGQANLATITSPGSPNSAGGYEIFRFNDTLQATAPVFIKVEYGGGNQAGNSNPAIWITVGTGTNGAGTITGVTFARLQLQILDSTTGTLSGVGRPAWTSGAANRVAQLLCRQGNSNIGNAFWAVERTKDAAGADTGEGVHVVARACVPPGSNVVAPNFWAQTLIFSIATAQTVSNGPMCVTNNDGTSTDAGNTGIFPWTMASKRGNENPPMGWLSYFYGDLNGAVDTLVTMYGAAHTYRTLGADAGQTNAQGVQRAGWRPTSTSTAITAHDSVQFAMRWE
jgi:hypothetical protein